MKYLKTFEVRKQSKLFKLFKYLKKKGLDVEYIDSDVVINYDAYISGDTDERPYMVELKGDDFVIVDYMNVVDSKLSPDGKKRGAWRNEKFGIMEHEKIYDFIINLDMIISAKNYNL